MAFANVPVEGLPIQTNLLVVYRKQPEINVHLVKPLENKAGFICMGSSDLLQCQRR